MAERLEGELTRSENGWRSIIRRLAAILKAHRNRRVGIEQNREMFLVDTEQMKKHLSEAQEIVYRRTSFLRELPAVYRKQAETDLSFFCWGPDRFTDYYRERLRWGLVYGFLEVVQSVVGAPLRSQGNAFVEMLSSHSLQSRLGFSAGPNPRRLSLYEATIIQVPRGHKFLEKHRTRVQFRDQHPGQTTLPMLWNSEVDPKPESQYESQDFYQAGSDRVISNTLRQGEQWWRVSFGSPESTTRVPTNIIYATSKIRPDINHNLSSPNRQDFNIDLVLGRITVSTYQDPEWNSVYVGASDKGTEVSRTIFELGSDGWASPTFGDSEALHYVSFVREIAETIPKEMFVVPPNTSS